MKKYLISGLVFFLFYIVEAQPIIQRASSANTVADSRLMINLNLFLPKYKDTISASMNKGVDSVGSIWFNTTTNSIWIRQHNPKKWVNTFTTVDTTKYVKYADSTILYVTPKQLRDSLINKSAIFTKNLTLNGDASTRLGVWTNGQTIPLAGLSLDSGLYVIGTKCNPPTYVSPTATISASPSSGSYERGTNLGTITLTAGGNANNSGGFTVNTFYQNSSPLGGNTTTISSLTSTNTFYVARTYSQGAILNDNCGVPDPTGRINAGTVNSSNISFTPFDKRYYGFVNSTSPSNSDILALSQDNSGSSASLTLTNVTPSGSQFLAYFTKGTVTSVTVNGIPATGAFTITTYSVTNAQGFTSTYSYIYSNNAQTTTLSSVIFN